MRIILLLATSIFLLANCGPATYTIHINNLSAKAFDSINVLIISTQGNKVNLKFEGVAPGEVVYKTISGNAINAKHDIAIVPVLYASDTTIRNWGTYNDLGVFKENYKMTIDSSLKIKWEEW